MSPVTWEQRAEDLDTASAALCCPQCGENLIWCGDEIGTTYQCPALDCLGLFEAAEVEPDSQ